MREPSLPPPAGAAAGHLRPASPPASRLPRAQVRTPGGEQEERRQEMTPQDWQRRGRGSPCCSASARPPGLGP